MVFFSFFHINGFILSPSYPLFSTLSTVFASVDILPLREYAFVERDIEELGRGGSQQWKFQG